MDVYIIIYSLSSSNSISDRWDEKRESEKKRVNEKKREGEREQEKEPMRFN